MDNKRGETRDEGNGLVSVLHNGQLDTCDEASMSGRTL